MAFTIKDRLQDNLIASTALDRQLVPGLGNVAAKGPIVAPVGLDKIAENISINMAQLPEGASHARPSMLASISSFAENIRAALDAVAVGRDGAVYAGLSTACKQDFVEWQGMIAVVALCNIYGGMGLKLSVDPFYLTSGELVQRCILNEMDKDACYRSAITRRDPVTGEPLEGYLHYICQNDKPFALYHPEIGLCPMKSYSGQIFDGVIDWHISQMPDCHKAWTAVMEPNGRSLLDDFCLSRIAWWAGKNGLIPYQQYIQSRMQDPDYVLDEKLGAPNSIENAANIDNVWPGKGSAFGTAPMFYLDNAGVARPMPKLFIDTLLITYVGNPSSNKQIYNSRNGEKTIAFSGNHPELAELAPVAPFSKAVMDLLETGTLEQLTFDPVIEAGCLRSVSVGASISTRNSSVFTIHKTYSANQLRFGKLPYLMLWPFVPMPAGLNLWNSYYATWEDISEEVTRLKDANGKYIKMASELTFSFEDQGEVVKVYRPPNDKQYWSVCVNTSPFRYALVDGMGVEADKREPLGIVFMPKYPTYPLNDQVSIVNKQPVKLAVDFGTTSTVCAIRTDYLNDGKITPLSFRDYGRAVSCDNADAKRVLDMEHWLGNAAGGSQWSWDSKIFSVAQLFERKEGVGPQRNLVSDAEKQKYYADGRMFLISGNSMMNYATPTASDQDPLKKQQIMNDMKFNEKLDVMNYQAASIFLAGIYIYAVLHLLNEKIVPGGCDFLELRVSYPNMLTMNALKSSWSYAKSILNRVMSSNLTHAIDKLLESKDHFYSEAIATSAYQRTENLAVRAARNLISVDIGGGTTDISITSVMHPGRTENLSLRYAGREMMVSSLISYFRRFDPNAQFDLDSEFKSIWHNPEDAILNQFHGLRKAGGERPTLAFLHSLLTNSSARIDVELLLSEGMQLKPAELSPSGKLLRELITLKFLMIMRVTACTMREHIDMWKDPITGQLVLVNGELNVNLSISGTSAQMLQYVCDCSMRDLEQLKGSGRGLKIENCRQLLNLLFTDVLADEIPSDAKVNLVIHIDPDVKEKREVCYGMLQNNIDDFMHGPAVAAENVQQALNFEDIMLNLNENDEEQSDELSDAERRAREAELYNYLSNYPIEKLNTYLNGKKSSDGKKLSKGLIDYMKAYVLIMPKNTSANLGLGNVQAIHELLMKYSANALSYAQMDVAETRRFYMVEKEQDAYRDELACMYLVDEILDWEMAALQTRN